MITDADAAAVVDADDVRARRAVQQGVQDRPVGDRVGAVAHRLRLAVRLGDAPGVEVVAGDDDRRRDFALGDEFVDAEREASAFGQPILGRVSHQSPGVLTGQGPWIGRGRSGDGGRLLREQLLDRVVCPVDVRGVARERGPAERTFALTEQRADVRGTNPGKSNTVSIALVLDLSPDVVAVLEGDGTALLQFEMPSTWRFIVSRLSATYGSGSRSRSRSASSTV